MFTGIIEGKGKVCALEDRGKNRRFWIEAPFTYELKVDQSVAHDGACLTVVELNKDANQYAVDAIAETLRRTRLGDWKVGTSVNLERSMISGGRLDGHIVQGHVDLTVEVLTIEQQQGSWRYEIALPDQYRSLVVEKGSIAVNGISLTVGELTEKGFAVYIIPYTFLYTTMSYLSPGNKVNLEFDILGKYVARQMEAWQRQQLAG